MGVSWELARDVFGKFGRGAPVLKIAQKKIKAPLRENPEPSGVNDRFEAKCLHFAPGRTRAGAVSRPDCCKSSPNGLNFVPPGHQIVADELETDGTPGLHPWDPSLG